MCSVFVSLEIHVHSVKILFKPFRQILMRLAVQYCHTSATVRYCHTSATVRYFHMSTTVQYCHMSTTVRYCHMSTTVQKFHSLKCEGITKLIWPARCFIQLI